MAARGHRHISLDLSHCKNKGRLQSGKPPNHRKIANRILKLAQKAGCTIRKWHLDTYKPEEGYSLVVTIAESHFTVLTWPESEYGSFVNIDVYVCNYTRDNSHVARNLEEGFKKFFQPGHVKRWEKLRGPWNITR